MEKIVIRSMIKSKKLITKYASVISISAILLFSGYLSLREQNQEQEFLNQNSENMLSQIQLAIDQEIQSRIDNLFLFRNTWVSTDNISNCYNQNRYEILVDNYYDVTSGIKAINWIDVNGTIRWVHPHEENVGAINKSVRVVTGDIFNTAFAYAEETGNLGILGLINFFQGGYGFTSYLPLIYENRLTGYLNGVFDLGILYEDIFSNKSGIVSINQYSVSIYSNNSKIFGSNENFSLSSPFVVSQEFSVQNSFNLTLGLRPLQEYRERT